MKIKIDITDDCVDLIVVAALRRSIAAVRYCVRQGLHTPADKEYAKKHAVACKHVIEHFGGKP